MMVTKNIYNFRKNGPVPPLHNKQQAGNKSICTEERGGGSYDSYKYVLKFR